VPTFDCPSLWLMDPACRVYGKRRNDDPAAIRETLEEACARVDIRQLFSLINVPHINQVHLFYRARLLDIGFSAGLETLETALFSEVAIPWQDLAFQSVTLCLKAYFSDRSAGRFVFHEETLQPHQDWHRVSDHPKG